MIVYRHAPQNYPFIWESDRQPAGRWHAAGEGPVHYFADTPDGAWAEFLRHAEIEDPLEFERVRRTMWAIEIAEDQMAVPTLSLKILTGGRQTYAKCQSAARYLRRSGVKAIAVPSAALRPGCARGFQTQTGLQPAPPRNGRVLVYFRPLPDAVGWVTGTSAVPSHIKPIYNPL